MKLQNISGMPLIKLVIFITFANYGQEIISRQINIAFIDINHINFRWNFLYISLIKILA